MTQNDQGTGDAKGDDINDQNQQENKSGEDNANAGGDDGGQSDGADKTPLTLEEITELVQGEKGLESKINGLITGYTTSREQINKMNESLDTLTTAINKKTGAEEGDEDYVTKSGMKEIIKNALSDNVNSANKQKEDNETAIDNALTGLRAEGVISSKEDEDSLIKHAVKIEQPDLRKAALSWQEVKKAGEDAIKDAAKREAKKKEGDGVGSPSGSTGSEQGGVDYAKLKKMQESGEL